MKKILKYFPVVILLLFCNAAKAQNSSALWTAWQQHSCYKGLSISVKNMGYNKDNKTYYWGVRIQNNYDKAVTFRYLLSVGGEKDNASKNYYQVAWKLAKGAIHTDGGDAFTADMFKSPSDDWMVMIGELCFDGMRCGGNDDCYASCDVVEKKINQSCGLEAASEQTNNNTQNTYTGEKGTAPDTDGDKKDAIDYNGQYSKWEQEGKDVVMTIGISETGIFWKEKEGKPPVFFKNIKPGVFRYDKGNDFMLVRFESEDRLSLWNNGSLVGYFKNPAFAKKPEPKKEETVKIKTEENKPKPVTEEKNISIGEGLSDEWYGEGNIQRPIKLKTTSNGLIVMYPESNIQFLFNKTGENKYQKEGESSPGIYFIQVVSFFNAYTIRIAFKTKENYPGYDPNVSYDYYHNKSLVSNPSKIVEWINTNPQKQWNILRLVTTEVGIYNYINPQEKVIRFFRKTTTTNTYIDDSGYKTYLKLNGTNSVTLEYCDQNGQVNQTENFIRKTH